MAAKKSKAAPAKKGKSKAATTKNKTREPPPKMLIRRNAAPIRSKSSSTKNDEPSRTSMGERFDGMGGSHVAAGIGAGALGNICGIVAVGQGWVGPKITAGLLMGTGVAATAAGWYWEMDHMMAAGAGLTTAGAFSMTNQIAVDTYEAMEKKAEERQQKGKKEADAKEREKRLADARALLAAEQGKQRNTRRIVVMDQNGEPIDDYSAQAA